MAPKIKSLAPIAKWEGALTGGEPGFNTGGMNGDQLSAFEKRRYARHLILPEVGVEGQRSLLSARVLCIGAGGLGSPVLMYLAAAGVGHIGLVEFDRVDESNLQRQIIHGQSDVGQFKGESARRKILEINPECHVEWINESLHKGNALDLVRQYDLVIDGTDNFPTRFLVNDACVMAGKPNVYGSIFRFEGQASVFAPTMGGPCYRCLFPEPPPPGAVPSCAEGGVLGVLPGIIGSIQANEAIKLIIGKGEPLINRLLVMDSLGMEFRMLKIQRDPGCAMCGDHPTITELMEYTGYCSLPHHETDAVTDSSREGVSPLEISLEALRDQVMAPDCNTTILDVREPGEHAICHIEGARLVPLGRLAEALDDMDPSARYLVHCKSGKRSMQAVELMRARGFIQAWSVRGGIIAWAEEFDSSMATY